MNNDLEQFSEERLKELASVPEKYDHRYTCNMLNSDESRALARIALAAKQAEIAGFITSTGSLLENEIQAKANIEGTNNTYQPLYTTPQPAHTEQDGFVSIPKDMLADYRDVKNSELQTYKASFGSHCDIPGSRWQRDLADLTEELAEIDKLIAAAPKPESK
jgi:hypothetical protein